jgi:hypothetical protein
MNTSLIPGPLTWSLYRVQGQTLYCQLCVIRHSQGGDYVSLISWVGWDWVHLVRRPLIGLLYQPRMTDDECGAVGGIRIGRGNRITRRKPATVPHCPPKIPHELTWARIRADAVGSRRLTAWAMAQPDYEGYCLLGCDIVKSSRSLPMLREVILPA